VSELQALRVLVAAAAVAVAVAVAVVQKATRRKRRSTRKKKKRRTNDRQKRKRKKKRYEAALSNVMDCNTIKFFLLLERDETKLLYKWGRYVYIYNQMKNK